MILVQTTGNSGTKLGCCVITAMREDEDTERVQRHSEEEVDFELRTGGRAGGGKGGKAGKGKKGGKGGKGRQIWSRRRWVVW